MNENHLDRRGRLQFSVEPKNQKVFNAAVSFVRNLGLNRSKFLVEAAILTAMDYGFEPPQEQEESKQ